MSQKLSSKSCQPGLMLATQPVSACPEPGRRQLLSAVLAAPLFAARRCYAATAERPAAPLATLPAEPRVAAYDRFAASYDGLDSGSIAQVPVMVLVPCVQLYLRNKPRASRILHSTLLTGPQSSRITGQLFSMVLQPVLSAIGLVLTFSRQR